MFEWIPFWAMQWSSESIIFWYDQCKATYKCVCISWRQSLLNTLLYYILDLDLTKRCVYVHSLINKLDICLLLLEHNKNGTPWHTVISMKYRPNDLLCKGCFACFVVWVDWKPCHTFVAFKKRPLCILSRVLPQAHLVISI